MNVKKEMQKVSVSNVMEAPKHEFVEFSYSSKDAFDRREGVKYAVKYVKNVVAGTGGDMPKALFEAYEAWYKAGQTIQDMELGVIKVGR